MKSYILKNYILIHSHYTEKEKTLTFLKKETEGTRNKGVTFAVTYDPK